ncbi:hypothetical protein ABMA28_015073 [Loxostege sticticalis]|uniref:Uncharacterized protein n=1 Tax=Loxostege sticticalis TaxID=481309 RepID=A0ABD0TEA7_LOXSC
MSSLLLIKSMLLANALKKSHKKKKRKVKKSPCDKKVNGNLCRICNDERGDIHIFNNTGQLDIPKEIKNFSGVVINKMENYSNHICQSCIDLLNGCILFRDMCQKSNERMSEISIKKEYTSYKKDKTYNADSDDSYNIPTPTFSEENTEIWDCSTCTKEFGNMTAYNRHLPKCTAKAKSQGAKPKEEVNKKTFLCDICGKTACSNASLQSHMGTHENNVFPYKCEQCPYQGRTIDLLKVHKRSHLADKPYKCSQCPKSTTTASNLSKHMRHVHSNARPYKCSYCDKAFSYLHDMKRHVKDIHLRQGTVECNICYKKFNTKKILQGHRWKIHKIKGERSGRLPSYLQCQMGRPNENVNRCEQMYEAVME